MRDFLIRFLGLDEWQAEIEAQVGMCRIRLQDSDRALLSENAHLRNQVEKLTALLELKMKTPDSPKRMTIRQEIEERTKLAFEEDAKRGAVK
jgi:hypothetical protein